MAMLKILDRYILTTFLKTFFPLFFIIMFVLLLQTIWLFISELAGKDLDFSVIIKFLTFAIPRLIPMVLPLTILLTSIMIFGSFAENYEFAAMKSSGISLQRAMRTLTIFVIFIGFGAFWFANTVMPLSEKKFINLRKNLLRVKPAMAITAGQFNDLGDINIKVADKYGENDRFLKDVIIHKRQLGAPGNFTVIKANEGELKGNVNSDLITLALKDGNYYDEIQSYSAVDRKPFAKAYFTEYVLNIDLSLLEKVDIDAQRYQKGYNMLNVSQLRKELDTISKRVNKETIQIRDALNKKNGYTDLNKNLKIHPTKKMKPGLQVHESFTNTQYLRIIKKAFSNTDAAINQINSVKKRIRIRKRALNKYEMSLHDKYALGISCVLLFFIGAPLGAIIRKGGMGLPMVVGVLLFLTYHFVTIFSKNGAEEGGIPPFVGSWLSTFIIFPLSIYLTHSATRDRGLPNMDAVVLPIKQFFQKYLAPLKPKKERPQTTIPTVASVKGQPKIQKQTNYSAKPEKDILHPEKKWEKEAEITEDQELKTFLDFLSQNNQPDLESKFPIDSEVVKNYTEDKIATPSKSNFDTENNNGNRDYSTPKDKIVASDQKEELLSQDQKSISPNFRLPKDISQAENLKATMVTNAAETSKYPLSYRSFKDYSMISILLSMYFIGINLLIHSISQSATFELEVMLLTFNVLAVVAYCIYFFAAVSSLNALYKTLEYNARIPALLGLIAIGFPCYVLVYWGFKQQVYRKMQPIF